MAKAYWIARVDVHDPETYKLYIETAAPARGGRSEILEGGGRARNVIIEFPSMAEARACYDSPEYTRAAEYRRKASTGEFVLVEAL